MHISPYTENVDNSWGIFQSLTLSKPRPRLGEGGITVTKQKSNDSVVLPSLPFRWGIYWLKTARQWPEQILCTKHTVRGTCKWGFQYFLSDMYSARQCPKTKLKKSSIQLFSLQWRYFSGQILQHWEIECPLAEKICKNTFYNWRQGTHQGLRGSLPADELQSLQHSPVSLFCTAVLSLAVSSTQYGRGLAGLQLPAWDVNQSERRTERPSLFSQSAASSLDISKMTASGVRWDWPGQISSSYSLIFFKSRWQS